MTENYEVIENPPKKVLAKMAWAFAWRFYLSLIACVFFAFVVGNLMPSSKVSIKTLTYALLLVFPICSLATLWWMLLNDGMGQFSASFFYNKEKVLVTDSTEIRVGLSFLWRFICIYIVVYLFECFLGEILFDKYIICPLGVDFENHFLEWCLNPSYVSRKSYFLSLSLFVAPVISYLSIIGKTYGDKRLLIYRKKGDVI